MPSTNYDIVIIGAGIIGLATGMKLLEQFPKINLAILEKDSK
ncbi:MAG: FAD-dependent oxidoreductase, partial [SAR202 cluster bacterium]|nr:FAD-dependent oxidoreductase [SAR202 cluster bacterium]